MVEIVAPTREELQRVARGDERTLRALEALFALAGDLTPSELEQLSISSGTAAALAETAVGLVQALQDSLGTMAFQDADNVEITGGNVDSVIISESNCDNLIVEASEYNNGDINNCDISEGNIDDVEMSNSDINDSNIDDCTISGGNVDSTITDDTTALIASSATLSNGAGAGAGTLTNAPTAGNPTKWILINDNGTSRYIPTWT